MPLSDAHWHCLPVSGISSTVRVASHGRRAHCSLPCRSALAQFAALFWHVSRVCVCVSQQRYLQHAAPQFHSWRLTRVTLPQLSASSLIAKTISWLAARAFVSKLLRSTFQIRMCVAKPLPTQPCCKRLESGTRCLQGKTNSTTARPIILYSSTMCLTLRPRLCQQRCICVFLTSFSPAPTPRPGWTCMVDYVGRLQGESFRFVNYASVGVAPVSRYLMAALSRGEGQKHLY